MAKYSKLEVLKAMKGTGMVPVFYNADIEISKQVLKEGSVLSSLPTEGISRRKSSGNSSDSRQKSFRE